MEICGYLKNRVENIKFKEILKSSLYFIYGALIWSLMRYLQNINNLPELYKNAYYLLTVISLFMAGIILMLFYWKPVNILVLILLFIPLEKYVDIIPDFTTSTAEIIIFMTGIVWIIRTVRTKKFIIPELYLNIGWIVFFMMMFVSLVNAESKIYGLKQIVKWGEVLFVYLFVINSLRDNKKIYLMLNILLIIGIVLGSKGIIQFIQSKYDYFQVVGTFVQHNPYAGYLGLIVPVSLIFFIKENTKFEYIKYLFVFAILLIAMSVSFSRGALISFLIIYILTILFYKNRKNKTLLLSGFIILICVFSGYLIFQSYFNDRIVSRLKGILEDDSFKSRLSYLKIGFDMFKDHPLIGNGIGNYLTILPKFYSGADILIKCHLHNLYLQIMVEFGIIGLIGFIWLIVAHLKKLIDKLKKINDSTMYSIGFGCLLSIIAFLTHNLFDVLFTHSIGLLFGIILAITVTLNTEETKN